MPANGNSGWIDEAIASWRDKGYQRNPTTGFGGSDLGGQSVYKRNTDKRAYALGAAFMAYLDYKLQDSGGLKAFLKGYFQTYKHQVITEQHFKNNLEFFSGLNLDADFGTYIWGTNSDTEHLHETNLHHSALTKDELKSIL
jgi:predicted metalloprotease with PDZ domain